jgi:hypothetical protein
VALIIVPREVAKACQETARSLGAPVADVYLAAIWHYSKHSPFVRRAGVTEYWCHHAGDPGAPRSEDAGEATRGWLGRLWDRLRGKGR